MSAKTEELFITYSFTFDGRDYISKVSADSPLLQKIANLPIGLFEEMNISCLDELVGKGKSLKEIKDKLVEINANGSHAFIELA